MSKGYSFSFELREKKDLNQLTEPMIQPRLPNIEIKPSKYIHQQQLNHEEGDQSSKDLFKKVQEKMGDCQGFFTAYFPLLRLCFQDPYPQIPEKHSGIILRFGKFFKLIGPGQHYVNPITDKLSIVDKRERVVELNKCEVFSKDNVSFGISVFLFYKVFDSYKSKFNVQDISSSITFLVGTQLRSVIALFTIQEVLQNRDDVSLEILNGTLQAAQSWGIVILRVLIGDIFLPENVVEDFYTSALARNTAEAKLIHAKADVQSARMMQEAGNELDSDAAMQIRYLFALEEASNSNNLKELYLS